MIFFVKKLNEIKIKFKNYFIQTFQNLISRQQGKFMHKYCMQLQLMKYLDKIRIKLRQNLDKTEINLDKTEIYLDKTEINLDKTEINLDKKTWTAL